MDRLSNSQLLKSGYASQLVIVSPIQGVLEGKTLPIPLTEVHCPWGNRNRARNLGHAHANSDFIYHLDEDVEIPDFAKLERALKRLQTEKLSWIGGPYLNPKNLTQAGRLYNALSNQWARTGERSHPLFLGGHLLCRKGSIHWPEDLTAGGEEHEIAKTLHERGETGIFDSEFKAFHTTTHTYGSLIRRLLQHERVRRLKGHESRWKKLWRMVFC